MQTLRSLLYALLCVALQVLIFNRLHLWGGVAFIYLYPLIKMPEEAPRAVQILLGFLLGFVVDFFCNTGGMHALACGTMMWLRLPLLHLFVVAEDVKSGSLGMRQLGLSVFLRYELLVVSLFCLMLYLVEASSWMLIGYTLLKVVVSVVLTTSLSFVLELANGHN